MAHMKIFMPFLLSLLLSALPLYGQGTAICLSDPFVCSLGDTLRLYHPQQMRQSTQETVYVGDSLVQHRQIGSSATPSFYPYVWLLGGLLFLSAGWLCYHRNRYRHVLSTLKHTQSDLEVLHAEQEADRSDRQRLATIAIVNSPICQEMRFLIERHKGTLHTDELPTPAQWKQLTDNIDLYFNHFTRRLHEQHPLLKKQDIRFCCLIKAGFKYADIACLLGRTPNMMYKRRDAILSRLNQKLSGSDFEAFIRQF